MKIKDIKVWSADLGNTKPYTIAFKTVDEVLNAFVEITLENGVTGIGAANPSGPAGSEWIVSGDANAVVLQHNPPRKQYKDMEYYPAYIPEIKDEIALIKIYGAPTVAITINTSKMKVDEARQVAGQYEKELGIPAVLPLEDGVEKLIPVFEKLIKQGIS